MPLQPSRGADAIKVVPKESVHAYLDRPVTYNFFNVCSPPEELVLPKRFPKAPFPAAAALVSPLAWQFGRPDLFDSYSAGVLLMQMAGAILHQIVIDVNTSEHPC